MKTNKNFQLYMYTHSLPYNTFNITNDCKFLHLQTPIREVENDSRPSPKPGPKMR